VRYVSADFSQIIAEDNTLDMYIFGPNREVQLGPFKDIIYSHNKYCVLRTSEDRFSFYHLIDKKPFGKYDYAIQLMNQSLFTMIDHRAIYLDEHFQPFLEIPNADIAFTSSFGPAGLALPPHHEAFDHYFIDRQGRKTFADPMRCYSSFRGHYAEFSDRRRPKAACCNIIHSSGAVMLDDWCEDLKILNERAVLTKDGLSRFIDIKTQKVLYKHRDVNTFSVKMNSHFIAFQESTSKKMFLLDSRSFKTLKSSSYAVRLYKDHYSIFE
jgi:hypothetical protein